MTLRTKPDTADTFLVFDAEDPLHASLCRGEAEVREIIDQFGCTAGLQVLRITMGELVRDVTADFIGEDEATDSASSAWDRSASRADRLYQERMEGVR
ncbi:hypothetical protein ATER59S_02377 [Aquamicrobium terrae]